MPDLALFCSVYHFGSELECLGSIAENWRMDSDGKRSPSDCYPKKAIEENRFKEKFIEVVFHVVYS